MIFHVFSGAPFGGRRFDDILGVDEQVKSYVSCRRQRCLQILTENHQNSKCLQILSYQSPAVKALSVAGQWPMKAYFAEVRVSLAEGDVLMLQALPALPSAPPPFLA